MDGILNLNKPAGLTSRDVVTQVSRLVGRSVKCGHAGTLDPLATGVLIVCLGKATKLVPLIHEHSKAYVGEFLLGKQSETDDVEGMVVEADLPELTADDIRQALPRFIGRIEQIPPAHSAIKIDGERAYKAARRGEDVQMPSRIVEISELELTGCELPCIELTVTCGTGTYIRALGRDIARALGTEAVMSSLVRTRIGPFLLADSIDLASLTRDNLNSQLLSPISGLPHLLQYQLDDDQARRLRFGQKLETGNICSNQQMIAAVDSHRSLVAIVECRNSQLVPKIVFPADENT